MNTLITRTRTIPSYNILQLREISNPVQFQQLERENIEKRLIRVLCSFHRIGNSDINSETHFVDMGLDSLDSIELCLKIEDEFMVDISEEDTKMLNSIPDVVEYISRHPWAT